MKHPAFARALAAVLAGALSIGGCASISPRAVRSDRAKALLAAGAAFIPGWPSQGSCPTVHGARHSSSGTSPTPRARGSECRTCLR
jgi:hypothetical protein